MLTLYTLCFIIGGTFVALSAIAGFDGPDFDLDFDTDIEISASPSETPNHSIFSEKPKKRRFKLPFLSFKFWTFGLCFFGLTGIALSHFQPDLSTATIAGLSAAMGILCGTTMVAVLSRLQEHHANSLVHPNDLIGLPAIVEIPFNRDSKGKVRVSLNGMNLDLMALTESSQEFSQGQQVYIVGMENHKVWVVERESFGNYP